MLSSNFLYGHAIEISIGLSLNANILSDFPGETLIRTAVTFLRTSKYIQRCYESKIIGLKLYICYNNKQQTLLMASNCSNNLVVLDVSFKEKLGDQISRG